MSELVPNVARAYWRVLGSIVSCLVAVVVGATWHAITRDRPFWAEDTDDDNRRWWPGLFWVIYAVAAGVGIAVLGAHLTAPWQRDAVIAAAVLGVLPIYGACPWSRPGEDRLIYKRASAETSSTQRTAWPWGARGSRRNKSTTGTTGGV